MEANRIPGLVKIPLPDFLFPELFGDNLVRIPNPGSEVIAPPLRKVLFLGGNGSRIVFMVSDPAHKYLDEDLMDFLQGLLKACGLTMDDIALVNFQHDAPVTYLDIIGDLSAQKMVVFGVPPRLLQLPVDLPDFQIENVDNLSFLFCPPLSEIQSNKETKRRLWACLQSIFQLK